MDLSKLIPIGRASDIIGFKRTTLYERIKRGELQAVKVGTRTFLTDREIDRFRRENSKILGRRDETGEAA